MKKYNNYYLTIAILLVTSTLTFSKGIKFETSTWEETKAKAKRENKPIFVDFYATWCGPCTWMTNDVFTDVDLGEYFNENFISYKIDAEKDYQELVEKIDLSAYPTLVFFDAEELILKKNVGALDVSELRLLADEVKIADQIKGLPFESLEEEQQMVKLKMMNEIDHEEFNKIVNPLFNKIDKSNYQDSFNWFLITTFKKEDSRFYDYILEDISTIHEAKGDELLEYISEVNYSIFKAAVDETSEQKLNRYKELEYTTLLGLGYVEHDRKHYDQEANIYYYDAINDYEKYFEELENWIVNYHYDDADILAKKAYNATQNSMWQTYFADTALEWAKRAVSLDDNAYSNYVYSFVNYQLDNYELALEHAKRILDFELEAKDIQAINGYINEIESMM